METVLKQQIREDLSHNPILKNNKTEAVMKNGETFLIIHPEHYQETEHGYTLKQKIKDRIKNWQPRKIFLIKDQKVVKTANFSNPLPKNSMKPVT